MLNVLISKKGIFSDLFIQTAMEVWLLACMMLVFFSLVEYTIILRRSVNYNRYLEKIKKEPNYPVRSSNGVR